MEYRQLGSSGIQISALSFGTWLTFGKQIGDTTADDLMSMAYDAGVNFFDNAEIYSRGQSESVMGEILKKKDWRRSSYLVSTKVFWGTNGKETRPNESGLSRKHIFEGCHDSLKRLQLDYIDLYFCHRPDKKVPIEETVWAMNLLIQQGKILYWGTSEWDASEIMEAIMIAQKNHLIGPVMEQPQYNMMVREKLERDYLHLFKYHKLGTTIWSPLGSGVLTGKHSSKDHKESTRFDIEGMDWLRNKLLTEDNLRKAEQTKKLAEELGTTLPKLSLAWCLKNPNVSTVILGASKTTQLKENLDAVNVLPLLTNEVMLMIEGIWGNKPELPEY